MELVSFTYSNTIVRTQVTDGGEPLFCANDVCAILGYANARDAVATHVDTNYDVAKRDIIDSLGRTQSATFVTESGLYALIFGSKLESAKEFKRWVTSEVLPSIRKTGRYEVKAAPKSDSTTLPLKDLIEVTKLVLEPAGIKGNQLTLALDKVVKKKTGESALALSGVQLKAPQQEHLVTPTDLGKQVGLSPQKINKILEEAGLQCKDTNDKWTPTEKGLALGAVLLDVNKAHSSGTPVRQLKWSISVLDSIKQFINN